MLRHCFILVGLFAASTLSSGGCRSCSDCHDYDPPVADCECSGYGQRTGSVSCGCGSCGTGGCSTGGSAPTGGCGCGHCGGGSGGSYEGESGPMQPQMAPAEEEVGT